MGPRRALSTASNAAAQRRSGGARLSRGAAGALVPLLPTGDCWRCFEAGLNLVVFFRTQATQACLLHLCPGFDRLPASCLHPPGSCVQSRNLLTVRLQELNFVVRPSRRAARQRKYANGRGSSMDQIMRHGKCAAWGSPTKAAAQRWLACPPGMLKAAGTGVGILLGALAALGRRMADPLRLPLCARHRGATPWND